MQRLVYFKNFILILPFTFIVILCLGFLLKSLPDIILTKPIPHFLITNLNYLQNLKNEDYKFKYFSLDNRQKYPITFYQYDLVNLVEHATFLVKTKKHQSEISIYAGLNNSKIPFNNPNNQAITKNIHSFTGLFLEQEVVESTSNLKQNLITQHFTFVSKDINYYVSITNSTDNPAPLVLEDFLKNFVEGDSLTDDFYKIVEIDHESLSLKTMQINGLKTLQFDLPLFVDLISYSITFNQSNDGPVSESFIFNGPGVGNVYPLQHFMILRVDALNTLEVLQDSTGEVWQPLKLNNFTAYKKHTLKSDNTEMFTNDVNIVLENIVISFDIIPSVNIVNNLAEKEFWQILESFKVL